MRSDYQMFWVRAGEGEKNKYEGGAKAGEERPFLEKEVANRDET